MSKWLLGAAGLLLLASPALSFDSETRVVTSADFISNDQLSGIACADPAGSWPRHCIAVVDEGISVQRTTLDQGSNGYTLTPGDTLATIRPDGKAVSPPFIGTAPNTACSDGDKKADELDAEGVTFAGGLYYVTGSHGCGRNSHAARLSGFLVTRFAPAGTPEVSYRLNEALASLPELGKHFAKDLQAGGVSIEGVAGLGDPVRLYFGLRSPADGSKASVISVVAGALFEPDANLDARLLTVDLSAAGNEMGVRDLATIDGESNRMIILIGPALGEGGPFAVADYDVSSGERGPITPIASPAGGKAEGLLLVDRLATKAKVLVLHDALANGAPLMDIIALH